MITNRPHVAKMYRDKPHKSKKDVSRSRSPKAQFYDTNHTLVEKKALDFDFSRGPNRDRHKSAFVQRSKVTLLDKFYDTGNAKEKFTNTRLTGDPQIKHQLGRDEVNSHKKKRHLGQDKFYIAHQWPGGVEEDSFHQSIRNYHHQSNGAADKKVSDKNGTKQHLIDGKAYVEFSRKNELDRYDKFSSNGNSQNPPVGAYEPRYNLTHEASPAHHFSRAPARQSQVPVNN
ncbi:pre-mRNA-splicing factor SLU7 [Acrasis kona]|uniref:Pre-mRNA-splicing factor SLU7 n=1 Tax=Acrasis kona TaxID=1008807 RepID=A0AAW2YVL1_9EUKA